MLEVPGSNVVAHVEKQCPRPQSTSGWHTETSISCSMGFPGTTELLFLSMQMFDWGPDSHGTFLKGGHFPLVPGQCTGCVTAEPQAKKDSDVGCLKWCSLPHLVRFCPSALCGLSPTLLANIGLGLLALQGFCKDSFSLFLLTLMDGVCWLTSSWYFLQAHEAHGPFLHPRLHLYQEFLWNILFFCLKILSIWEKRNLARYQTAQSEQKHHSVHMQ